MTIEMNDNILTWFTDLSDAQRALAEPLRDIIYTVNTDLTEDIKWKMPNYSLNKLVCYLQKSKTHVTIGFQQGAHLNDPNRWLQGEGKDMRHIKMALGGELDVKKVKYLVEQAILFDQKRS